MTDRPSRRLFLQRAATSGATIAAFGVSQPPSAAQGVDQPDALQGLPALDGSIVQDDAAIRAAGRDGGGMAQRRPRAVLKPGSVEDIVKIVRHANQRGVPIVMRGRGHARYGQSLVEGGIVIDSRSLAAVGKVAEGTIEVQAGASLESLVRAALDAGFALPVMTGCVMLSAGGFLSAGGQSRGSQRYGAFVDQVTELDVVTGDGRLVTCSETRDRELFEMVLAGMGQCGIIVRARLKVIPAREHVALRTLVYASLETFLRDQSRIASEQRFDVIEGAVVRSGGPNWSYHITVGNYGTATADIDPAERIRDLSPDTVTDLTRQDYRSYALARAQSTPPQSASASTPPAPTAAPQRRAAASPSLAMWVPASAVRELIATALPPPTDRGVVLIECTALDTRHFRRPLFRVPDEERMFALWVLRSAMPDASPTLDEQLAANRTLIERALALGARQYPPYSDITSPAAWERHYGTRLYQRFAAAKRRYDPKAILTPGLAMFA